MSTDLHPSGFVETSGSCSGPRRTRSQPSRESGGISSPNKHENIAHYINELGHNWKNIKPDDKIIIIRDLKKNIPELNNNPVATDDLFVPLKEYLLVDVSKNTRSILDFLYKPTGLTPDKEDDIAKSTLRWVEDKFRPTLYISILAFVVILGVVGIMVYIYTRRM